MISTYFVTFGFRFSFKNWNVLGCDVILRLNGANEQLFHDWLTKNYPDSYKKIFAQVKSMHNGKVNDSEFGRRMKGEGNLAESIHQLIRQAKKKYLQDKIVPPYNFNLFKRPPKGQLSMF